MKLNQGNILIEVLISILICSFIVNNVISISKLSLAKNEMVKKYESGL